jgi:formate dehydrogenase subunit gamma
MAVNRDMRVLARLLFLSCLALFAAPTWAADGGAKEQAQRQQTQPLNNAPVWRDVRSGETPEGVAARPSQTTQVRGIETDVLVQTKGEIWRQIRNGPITVYGGWLFVLAFLGALLFYWWKGPIKLHGQPTGRMIERFTPFERVLHWTTAISFVILAVSGLLLLFGKYVVLPIFGYTLFSWLAVLCKTLHNFVGPLFVVCTVIMFFAFVRDNLPRAYDWLWVRKAGGLFTGEHVPSGRFNAGEKGWFWIGVTLLGIIVSVSGLILDFPNFAQGRETMQQANLVHAIAAVLFMTMSLGHIYLGTIGQEGSYDSMRHGLVDETWAKEHHEYWYNEVKGQGRVAGGSPTHAHASAMKEGWKL